MKNYRDLEIWQRSHALTVLLYQVTKTFSKDEVFALTNQMRRAGVSIRSTSPRVVDEKVTPN